MNALGSMTLPKLDGYEIRPGIFLIGEPTPIPGTDKLRCLVNEYGALGVAELSIKFPQQAAALRDAAPPGEKPC